MYRPLALSLALVFIACSGDSDSDTDTDTTADTEVDIEVDTEPDTEADTEPDTDPVPVDCEQSGWSEWDTCSEVCNGGIQTRTRDVVTEPENGGLACGDATELQECNTFDCATPLTTKVVLFDGGAVSRINSEQWVLNTADLSLELEEQRQDDWSLYLLAADDTRYQVDLFVREVKRRDPGTTTADQYVFADIIGAEGQPDNGFSVTQVSYPQAIGDVGATATLIQIDETAWVQHDSFGVWTLEEVSRDSDTIELYIPSISCSVTVDLSADQITTCQGVEGTSLELNPADIDGTLIREALHSTGRFFQTGPTSWEETATDGTHLFDEVSRTAGGVQLSDIERDIEVFIDTDSDEIWLGTGNTGRILYSISERN